MQFTPDFGDDFHQVVKQAKAAAWRYARGVVWFEFNGIRVHVDAATDPRLAWRDYHNASYFKVPRKSIGPMYLKKLSKADAQEIAEETRKSEERSRLNQKLLDERRIDDRAKLNSEIQDVSLAIRDGFEAEYAAYVEKNSQDGYSRGVVDYAEVWAKLMQARLSAGGKLEDIAEQASHDADTDGITGFMYGCAVQALSRFWVHGDALKLWHNTDYGHPDAKGVINPAIFSIGNPA